MNSSSLDVTVLTDHGHLVSLKRGFYENRANWQDNLDSVSVTRYLDRE